MKINLWYIFGVILAIAIGIGLCVRGCEERRMRRTGDHSRKSVHVPIPPVLDTAYVAKIDPLPIEKPIVVPIKTKRQIRPDLTRRKRIATDATIVLGVTSDMDSIRIQSIDPKGIVIENSYPRGWIQLGKWEMDSTGRLRVDPNEYAEELKKQRRKERWKRVWRTTKTVGVAALAGWVGYQIAK